MGLSGEMVSSLDDVMLLSLSRSPASILRACR